MELYIKYRYFQLVELPLLGPPYVLLPLCSGDKIGHSRENHIRLVLV